MPILEKKEHLKSRILDSPGGNLGQKKKRQIKLEVCRIKEITKIRADINEIKTVGKGNKTKSWLFEKTHKLLSLYLG